MHSNGTLMLPLPLDARCVHSFKNFPRKIGILTNSLKYKNVNIGNFVLAVQLERNGIHEVFNLEM